MAANSAVKTQPLSDGPDWTFDMLEQYEAEIDRIAGAGHWLHADHPREFYDRLTGFLEKIQDS